MTMTISRTFTRVLLMSALTAGCAGEADPASRDDEAEVLAGISGPTRTCGDLSTPNVQVSYPAAASYANTEAFSTRARGNWWDRTDCMGFVADFVRTGTAFDRFEEAFIDGFHDATCSGDNCKLSSRDACESLVESRRIYKEAVKQGRLDEISDTTRKRAWKGGRCEPVLNTTVWLGAGPDTSGFTYWFQNITRVRVVAQAWMFAFPAHVRAYVQNDIQTQGRGSCSLKDAGLGCCPETGEGTCYN